MASKKSDEKDRISELPGNVMDCIFDLMGIRDAARTSILSRKWRYIWASYPQLVFDENFFKEIYVKHNLSIQYEFPNTINKVLLVHTGPILKFILPIPNTPRHVRPEIDQWMLFLSRNGIKELELDNSNRSPYIVPSCIFLCSSLIELKLKNCVPKTPCTFRGFRYLIKLELLKISFSAGMCATLLRNAPVLQRLFIMFCTGIEHSSLHAPMLEGFSIVESDKIDWQWFERNKQLTLVQVELGIEVKNADRKINMMKFLENIPNVIKLWLDGFSLKYLTARNRTQSAAKHRLPHSDELIRPPLAQFLKEVRLYDFKIDDLDQILCALCLLKSCPNLMNLEVHVAASNDNITEHITRYLEPTNCTDMNLNMLQTVKVQNVTGLKAELRFIKLLLANAICLQRMVIELDTAITASNGLKISTELLRFPRASTCAEIIYVVPSCS